ncbi:hypothetical protein BDV96DRAFT_642252 [Lophiotrema nucula]|uniref:Rhodopsin domain-containing protein n=1 Tax=Lophiotrema nucula TaxID=690887 RepID=A0A6A5ZJK1_9PLEO|nr:hypothetical protein BDV96DRAFT_642252 [Lophiotrema nucula]
MSTFTKEQLAYMQAHIHDTRVPDLYWIYSSAIVVSILSTASRVLAKRYTRNGVSLDDFFAITATACGIPYGLGRHIIVVESQHDLEMILKGEFVFTQINTWSVCFVKLTILTFYYRVFPIPTFQRVVIGTIIFVIAWSFGIWGVTTWGCSPIRKWWVTDAPGSCINLIPFGILANLLNVLTDFFIFLMPVPMLWKLKVSLARRLALCGIFSLGLATCVVTILRMSRIFKIQSTDFTWENVPISAFYVFEPVGGLLCINIPFVARAIRRRMKGAEASATSGPSTDNRPAQSSQRRKRRGSRWLIGIDSIRLTGLSSHRRSVVEADRIDARPWVQLPATSLSKERMAEDETVQVVRGPELSFYWEEPPRDEPSSTRSSTHDSTVEKTTHTRVIS